jgi:competence protein ComEC
MGRRVGAGSWPLLDSIARAGGSIRDRVAEVARRPHHVGAGTLAVGLAISPGAPGLATVAATTAAGLTCAAAKCAGTRPGPLALLAAVMVCAGAVGGAWRIDAIDRSASLVGPDGTSITGLAVLLEHPRPSQFGSSASIRMISGQATGAPLLARLSGPRPWPGGGDPGSILRVAGIAKQPAVGRSFDWRGYLRRRGIGFELALDQVSPTGERRGGPPGVIDSMRRRAEVALAARLSEPEAALARGMVLGQDEAVDELERDDFRRAGLAHVLAVSGQNVMLLCALALPLLARLGAGPRLRVGALLCLIAVYVPLAGAGASLQRAGVMGAAGLVALAAGRASSRWYALELAAVVTLVLNPRVVGDTGWQLSFAAVAGILVLAPPLQAAMRGLPHMLAEGAAVTLAATIATAPLIAHAFGSMSVAGIGANLVALPVVAGIMWAGMLQCALAQLPDAFGVAGAAIDLIGLIEGVLLGALRAIVRYFADAPGAAVGLPLGSRAGVALAYGLVGAGIVAVRRGARRAEPRATSAKAAWRRMPSRRRAVLVALAAGTVSLGWSAAAEPPAPPRNLKVSFLDVGQGDATLIQDGAGAAVLFDGGPPEARVYRRLRDAGVRHLDLVVSTHQSRDHQGGLHEVLEHVPTRLLVENGLGTRDPDYRRLIAEADARGVDHVAASAGQVFHVGRLTVQVLSPQPPPAGAPPPEDPNGHGVAAIVSEGAFDLWLSADAESDAILPLALRPVEAMKVSHHGSADPGLPRVLARLRPQVAAIEVGAGNSYGHPAPETLKALHGRVPHVYRTDEDGTVTISATRGALSVSTER